MVQLAPPTGRGGGGGGGGECYVGKRSQGTETLMHRSLESIFGKQPHACNGPLVKSAINASLTAF